jgi:transposase-like protein
LRPAGKAAGRINWAGARDEYVTGDESIAQLARRYGVTTSAAQKHSSDREANGGRTWSEWREEFRADVSGKRTEIAKRIKVEAGAAVQMRHAELLQQLANQATEAIENALNECEPKDRVKLALAIIAAERRIHGLDRTPVQVELTGKDGQPIEHDLTVDVGLDDDTRALAQRALEALFGETPE